MMERPIPMEKGGDDRTWVGSFVLSAPGARLPDGTHGRALVQPVTYRIHMVDDERTPNDSTAMPITVVPDLPPRVLLNGANGPPAADAVVVLNVRAADDHGLAGVHLMVSVNGEAPRELAAPGREFADKHHDQDQWQYSWKLTDSGLKVRDRVEYWAEAADHNDVTGPGAAKSRRLSFQVTAEEPKAADLQLNVDTLEDLLKRQRVNRKQTADNLNDLAAGPMADAVHLLESGRDAADTAKQGEFRAQSLPVQDKIIAELEDLLAALKRLERNQQAREDLKRIEKKDPEAYKKLTAVIAETINHLDDLLKDETQIAGKFEKLPTKNPSDIKDEEGLKALQSLDDLAKRTQTWSKGSVGELPKLAEGFVDDFAVRKDANRIYEEVEKAAQRAKSETIPVSAEDLGFALGTKMKEDLESWLPNAPDNAKWLLEDSPDGKSPKIPEMPLPKSLEDMIGDLLQKADEFDKDADDVTNSFAGNLDQAGWGVSDGPMASFSAKGKTGNDLPNSNELNGRSGDGRRGKSTGQMVGDTSRSLPGRPTPARVDDSKFETGNVKQEGARGPQRRDRRRQEVRRGPHRFAGRRAAGLREGHAAAERQAGRPAREGREGGQEARHDERVGDAAEREHRADEVDREGPGRRPLRGRSPQAPRRDGQAAVGARATWTTARRRRSTRRRTCRRSCAASCCSRRRRRTRRATKGCSRAITSRFRRGTSNQDRVDRVVAWDAQHSRPVGHHDVPALASNPEANLLQRPNRIEVIDARQLGHGYTSTSARCAPVADLANSWTTARYSRMASVMLARASARVAPWEWHPGRPGAETAKPSSDSSIRTVYFMAISGNRWNILVITSPAPPSASARTSPADIPMRTSESACG